MQRQQTERDAELLALVRSCMDVGPEDPVLVDEVAGTVLSVLVIGDGPDRPAPDRYAFVEQAGEVIQVEILPLSVLHALAQKAADNIRAIPPLRLLRRWSLWLARDRRGSRTRGDGAKRLRPMTPSGRLPLLLSDWGGRLLASGGSPGQTR